MNTTTNILHPLESKEGFSTQEDYVAALQRTLYPKNRHFKELYDDHFLFHSPKTNTSSYFFWTCEYEGVKFAALADSTGSDMSAALLGVYGFSLLNDIVNKFGHVNPAEILEQLHHRVVQSPELEMNTDSINDWIDISLCAYNEADGILHYCGANKKALIVSKNRTYLLPTNRLPIGGWDIEEDRKYRLSRIKVDKGDWIYFGTESYRSQLSQKGATVGSFGWGNLNKMMQTISSYEGVDQQQFLSENLDVWLDGMYQTEDVCVMGLRM